MSPPKIAPRAPKLPSPTEAAEAYVAKKAEAPLPPAKPKPTAADTYNATTFEPAKGVQHTDGKLSVTSRHEQLPSDLKNKVSPDMWASLPEGQKGTLISTYQNLKRYGVWDHVTKVTGQKELREAHVKLPGGAEGEVAGNSGAIAYEIQDRKGLVAKLAVFNKDFGIDGGVMGAMHAGQTSMREAGGDTSLHISLGPGDNQMDAHIDKVNPVNTPENGMTTMDLQRGVKHWSTEVLPEMIRKFTGLPGIIVKPELRNGTRENPTPDLRITANFEVRFGGVKKTEKTVKNDHAPGERAVPEAAMAEITKKVANGKSLPLPKGLTPNEIPTREAVAGAIAAQIMAAVERHDSTITIEIPQYAGQKGYQEPMTGEARRIADTVREELKKAGVDAGSVTSMKVLYGGRNEGATVSLLHNGE